MSGSGAIWPRSRKSSDRGRASSATPISSNGRRPPIEDASFQGPAGTGIMAGFLHDPALFWDWAEMDYHPDGGDKVPGLEVVLGHDPDDWLWTHVAFNVALHDRLPPHS